MVEVLFMSIQAGDVFTAGTDSVYEALSDPKPGEHAGELKVMVRRIAGPDTVTGIRRTEPGADWTDVKYDTAPVPEGGDFYAGWDEPVTLVSRPR